MNTFFSGQNISKDTNATLRQPDPVKRSSILKRQRGKRILLGQYFLIYRFSVPPTVISRKMEKK